jgi:hypothetical protein
MNQDRLRGLALLSIHRHIDVNIEDVINIFAKRQDRKLEILLSTTKINPSPLLEKNQDPSLNCGTELILEGNRIISL